MAAVGKLAVFMRIGNGGEHEIGAIELELTEGQLTFDGDMAALLRAAADQIEAGRTGQVQS